MTAFSAVHPECKSWRIISDYILQSYYEKTVWLFFDLWCRYFYSL